MNSTISLCIYCRISILLLSVAVFTAAIDLFFINIPQKPTSEIHRMLQLLGDGSPPDLLTLSPALLFRVVLKAVRNRQDTVRNRQEPGKLRE